MTSVFASLFLVYFSRIFIERAVVGLCSREKYSYPPPSCAVYHVHHGMSGDEWFASLYCTYPSDYFEFSS